MNKKYISIILPVYNAEETIERTLKSIESQSCTQYELIIINDGSTDNTEKICLNYLKNKRIKYISTKNNGVSHARNIGIANASGDYLCFIDDDDEYHQDFINTMLETVNKNDLLVCAYEKINVQKNTHRKVNLNDDISSKTLKEQTEILQSNLLFNTVWNKLYLKKIIKNNDIKFNCDISLGEDYIFNLAYIKNVKTIKYIDEILYYYYSKTSGLSLMEREDKLRIKIYNWEKNKELYIEKAWNLEYLYNQYIQICLSGISEFVFHKKFKENIKDNIIDYSQFEEIRKNSLNKKNKIIARIFLKNRILILYLLGILAKIYRKIYRYLKVD